MDNDEIMKMLIKLSEDIAVVKSKLEGLDKIQNENKEIDNKMNELKAQNEIHNCSIQSLQNRIDVIERDIKEEEVYKKRSNRSLLVSVGICLLTSIMNLIMKII